MNFQVGGDLRISSDGRDLVLASGALLVEQRIKNGATVFQGEWIYDLKKGLPYFQIILAKGSDLGLIRAVYVDFFQSIPGVVSVEKVDITVDTDTRQAVVKYAVTMDDGSDLSGELPYEIVTR